jgi:hypothetical protein
LNIIIYIHDFLKNLVNSRMLSNSRKVWLCLIGNVIAMITTLIIVCIFRDDNSTYFRFGPSEDLIVISVLINTWEKWIGLQLFIGVLKSCDVLVNELGSPILGFRIYNPDKKIINDFTKNELNFLANAMWFTNSFRSVLMVVVNITQFDIALSGMIMSEIMSIFTVRHLLNAKKFVKKNKYSANGNDDIDDDTKNDDIKNADDTSNINEILLDSIL